MNRNTHRPDEGHDVESTECHLKRSRGRQTPLSLAGLRSSTSCRLCTDGGTPSNSGNDHSNESSEETSDGTQSELPLTPSVREFILEDRHTECELCGADGADDAVTLEIHHRRERESGGTHHPENLLVLCQECHRRHHDNIPIENRDIDSDDTAESGVTDDAAGDLTAQSDQESTGSEAPPPATDRARSADGDGHRDDTLGTTSDDQAGKAEPLPPRSEPNGTDKEILTLLEDQGALSTGELADQTGYTNQYVRRQCWKLGGEQLIVPRMDNTWDLVERVDEGSQRVGLPTDPKKAKRAGRDEVIRQMSAHGMTHTEIADITDLSRSTIDIAVNRARALQIDAREDDEVDLATIATRLSALLELIDHRQMGAAKQTD